MLDLVFNFRVSWVHLVLSSWKLRSLVGYPKWAGYFMRSPMGVNSRFGCLHGETLAFLAGGGQKTGARRGETVKVVGWWM